MRAVSPADDRGLVANAGDGPRDAICRDASAPHTAYANFCEAARTLDEVVLTFAVGRAWTAHAGDAAIAVSHRIVMSAFVAQRLVLALAGLVAEHETRHGVPE